MNLFPCAVRPMLMENSLAYCASTEHRWAHSSVPGYYFPMQIMIHFNDPSIVCYAKCTIKEFPIFVLVPLQNKSSPGQRDYFVNGSQVSQFPWLHYVENPWCHLLPSPIILRDKHSLPLPSCCPGNQVALRANGTHVSLCSVPAVILPWGSNESVNSDSIPQPGGLNTCIDMKGCQGRWSYSTIFLTSDIVSKRKTNGQSCSTSVYAETYLTKPGGLKQPYK